MFSTAVCCTRIREVDETFDVQCTNGGHFPGTEKVDWPTCDSTDPPKCSDFLVPPQGSEISILDEVEVIPGGSVYYRCDNYPKMTTNLGMQVQVWRRDNSRLS